MLLDSSICNVNYLDRRDCGAWEQNEKGRKHLAGPPAQREKDDFSWLDAEIPETVLKTRPVFG